MASQSEEQNLDESQISESHDRTHSTIALATTTHNLKIVLAGTASVGKSSIILKFVVEKFLDYINPTINLGVYEKTIKIDPFTEAKLSIWDTAGAEKYVSFTQSYLRDANGVILVFDLSNEDSFKDLDMWLDIVNETIDVKNVPKILVGNKSDLPNIEISDERAKDFARQNGMIYMKVSAKDGINIAYLFEALGTACVKKIQELKNNCESDDDENGKNKFERFNIENKKKNGKNKKGNCC